MILFNNIRIAGISAAIPKTVVSNFKDHHFVSTKKREQIVKLTGVEEYRKATDSQTTADLCQVAAEDLFKEINVDQASIDGIIFVTMTPDYIAPSTACVMQHKLGLPTTTVAFDVNLGCSGYVYGLYIACSFILSAESQSGSSSTEPFSFTCFGNKYLSAIFIFSSSV